MSGVTYLASPYTHADPAVREARFRAVVKKAAELMLSGECVFSPIAHTHEIGLLIERPVDHDFWMLQDVAILRHCAKVSVLMLPGWMESKGVAQEIRLARDMNIPVEYVEP